MTKGKPRFLKLFKRIFPDIERGLPKNELFTSHQMQNILSNCLPKPRDNKMNSEQEEPRELL